MRDGLEESPVMVLQEPASVPNSVGTEWQQKEKKWSPIETVSLAPPIHPCQPPIPYPQRLAWAKLLHLEPKYARFLDVLKQVYVDTPFLEALRKTPARLQFVRDFLSKNGEPKGGSVMPVGWVYSSILQSPVKLQDPGNFFIPYYIGDVQIEGALYDLGASVSLMPLFSAGS